MRLLIKVLGTALAMFAALSSESASAQRHIELLRYSTAGSREASYVFAGHSESSFATALTIDAAGKLVIGDGQSFAVGRINANGSPDTGFGGDGFASAGAGYVEAVALQSGKIIAVGDLDQPGIAAARFNSDGSLDTTFGGGLGYVHVYIPDWEYSIARAAALKSDGRIVIVGEADSPDSAEYRFFVVQLTANGSLDTSFDGDGIKTIAFPSSTNAKATDVLINETGPQHFIAIVGTVIPTGSSVAHVGIAVVRPPGTMMGTFDADGLKVISLDSSALHSHGEAIALDSQGRFVLGGSATYVNSERRFGFARLRPSGALDTNFSSDGVMTMAIPGTTDAKLEDMTLDASGNIVSAGRGLVSGGWRFHVVTSVGPAGAPNAGFSGDGIATYNSASYGWQYSLGIAVDAQGKIWTAGGAED